MSDATGPGDRGPAWWKVDPHHPPNWRELLAAYLGQVTNHALLLRKPGDRGPRPRQFEPPTSPYSKLLRVYAKEWTGRLASLPELERLAGIVAARLIGIPVDSDAVRFPGAEAGAAAAEAVDRVAGPVLTNLYLWWGTVGLPALRAASIPLPTNGDREYTAVKCLAIAAGLICGDAPPTTVARSLIAVADAFDPERAVEREWFAAMSVHMRVTELCRLRTRVATPGDPAAEAVAEASVGDEAAAPDASDGEVAAPDAGGDEMWWNAEDSLRERVDAVSRELTRLPDSQVAPILAGIRQRGLEDWWAGRPESERRCPHVLADPATAVQSGREALEIIERAVRKYAGADFAGDLHAVISDVTTAEYRRWGEFVGRVDARCLGHEAKQVASKRVGPVRRASQESTDSLHVLDTPSRREALRGADPTADAAVANVLAQALAVTERAYGVTVPPGHRRLADAVLPRMLADYGRKHWEPVLRTTAKELGTPITAAEAAELADTLRGVVSQLHRNRVALAFDLEPGWNADGRDPRKVRLLLEDPLAAVLGSRPMPGWDEVYDAHRAAIGIEPTDAFPALSEDAATAAVAAIRHHILHTVLTYACATPEPVY